MRTSQSRAASRRTRGPRRASSCCAPTCSRPRTATLLQAAARESSCSSRRGHARRAARPRCERSRQDRRRRRRAPGEAPDAGREAAGSPRPELEFFNGLGGFADGRPRVRRSSSGRASRRPRPGSTSIANPSFGFQVSESGAAATPGRENSRENQLTPWSNDPVSDPPGEAIYVRDEETGELWRPTALPIRERGVDLRRAPRPGLQPVRARARTASRSSCSSSCRSTTRSRSRALTHREPLRPRRGGCR